MTWKGGGGWGNSALGNNKPKITPNITANKPGAAAAAVKRPAEAAAGGGLAKKPLVNGKTPIFTVSTKSESDEIGIMTLVGDYSEAGMNHGKKYYQKIQDILGHKDVKVFMYYFDNRDGPEFSGWWFGDELGGAQVWARCNSHGQSPPKLGWKIPWDAEKPEPGILMVEPYKAAPAAAAASSGPTPKAGTPQKVPALKVPAAQKTISSAELATTVKEATEKVEAAEEEAKEVLGKAKGLSVTSEESDLKELIEELTAQQSALNEAQKSLTQDINETRKGGPTAVTSVTALSRLSPRLRTLTTNVSAEVSKIRGYISKAANEKKNSEALKGKETEHKAEFEKALPELKESVSSAEDCVEAVVIMASPIVDDAPDEIGEVLSQQMDEVEKEASDAQEKIAEARKMVNTKLQAARAYAPEARKMALAEYTVLQDKLNEAQKKVNPYKNFKKDFAQRVEAKKQLADLVDKLAEAELEVEKAVMMSAAADQGQMTEDEVKASEELTNPALQALNNVAKLIEAKLKMASGPMKDELMQLKSRLVDSRKKLDQITLLVKRQREGLVLQKMTGEATEKVDAAEESLVQCQEAEMPFLKGIEVLPAEESTKAITESEKAAAASSKVIEQAKTFVKQKLAEARRYDKESAKFVIEELNELQQRLEEVSKKLNSFKSDTMDRKMSAVMAEVLDAVQTAERKGKDLAEAAALCSPEVLDDVNVEDIKAASEKASNLDKEVSAAIGEARKLVAAKQKEAKGGDMVQSLAKINIRLNAVNGELTKAKKATASADRLVKGKALLAEEEEKVKQGEDDVTKAEESATAEEGEKLSDENIKEMDKAMTSAIKVLKGCQSALQPQLTTALPAVKEPMQKLLERCKVGLKKMEDVKKQTKEQREVVMSDVYKKEGHGMAEAVEAAMNKVSDAELPFLMGTENLPLAEASTAIKASEEAAADVQTAINEARSFLAAKNIEVKGFKADSAKAALEEFAKLTERINGEAVKLSQFRKDTDLRKKSVQVQEATEKVGTLEALVEKVTEASKPFAEEQAEEDPKKFEEFSALDKEAKTKADEVRNLLGAIQRDSKGNADKMKVHSELQKRLNAALPEQTKARKLVAALEAKFKARAAAEEAKIKEAAEQKEADAILEVARAACALLDEDLKKIEETSAPLVKLTGDDLLAFPTPFTVQEGLKPLAESAAKNAQETKTVAKEQQEKLPKAIKGPMNEARKETMGMISKAAKAAGVISAAQAAVKKAIDTIAEGYLKKAAVAVREDMRKKDVSAEDLWTRLSAGGESISEEEFSKHLTGIEGSSISEEQAKIAAQKLEPGSIGYRSFLNFVQPFYVVVKEIAITSGFEVDTKAKAVRKAEIDELFEVLEGPTKDEKIGLERVRVRSLVDRVEGWVSVRGNNQGKVFLSEVTKPFYTCVKELPLEPNFASGGAPLRTIKTHEVLELVEGPRKETLKNAQRVRGKASLDGKMGWFTVKDTAGTELAVKGGKVYICTATVAMTDEFDIKACKVVKKLSVDEHFTMLEEPKEDENAKITRMKGRSAKDGTEGWVTIKGNAGSVYAKVNEKLWSIIADEVPFHDKFVTKEATVHRMLAKDEAVEGYEGPKEEKIAPVTRMKCRATSDGAVGWLTCEKAFVTSFSGSYKVVKAAPMHSSRSEEMSEELGASAVVRELEAGELLDLVEGPLAEGEEMRVKCRAKKDGVTGWVSFKDKEATPILQSL